MKTSPFLENLPVYQPGRPIEEVARELGLDPKGIIKLASNETRSARRAWVWPPCARRSSR